MEKEMIRVVDTEGIELEVELISILEDKEENNKYLVYTKGETQKNGNLILYISKVAIDGSSYVLENIDDDDEWGNVKRIMSEMVSK